jgi:hypothetical protein
LSGIVDITERLESLDPELLGTIESETSQQDKRSLLALHLACRRLHHGFRWLEVGSHLGGSLQALVRDPACVRIDSIDPRPEQLPDERFRSILYPDNSTARMMELLGALPGADTSKVQTHDVGTDGLDPLTIEQPHVCFIDGEHTDEACARDAEFCRTAVRGEGLLVFHDIAVVYRAVIEFVESLRRAGIPHSLAYLPDLIFAVELGSGQLLSDPAVVGRQLDNGAGLLRVLRQNDHYRAVLKGRRARVLRRIGLLRVDEH